MQSLRINGVACQVICSITKKGGIIEIWGFSLNGEPCPIDRHTFINPSIVEDIRNGNVITVNGNTYNK